MLNTMMQLLMFNFLVKGSNTKTGFDKKLTAKEAGKARGAGH